MCKIVLCRCVDALLRLFSVSLWRAYITAVCAASPARGSCHFRCMVQPSVPCRYTNSVWTQFMVRMLAVEREMKTQLNVFASVHTVV